MASNLAIDKQYKDWLAELKHKVRNTQIKAALKVNAELLTLYWELGANIVEKQVNAKWGDGLIEQLSLDLSAEFPDMKGFSRSNLMYIKKWYLFYAQSGAIVQQAVGQLGETKETQSEIESFVQRVIALIIQIPWGHNIAIITKCKAHDEALYYVQNTLMYGWSRTILVHQIESRLYQREGKASNNFDLTLPKPQSDLAKQILKDPYIFDFLRLTKEYNERDLENGLVEHITKFLLELGAGFSYLGRQYHLEIGGQDFYIDLLFYHVKLHCYVVIELKTTQFQPEYTGKLNFYLSAVDDLLRSGQDQPSIGILICKDKNTTLAEYALRDIHKPIGVSEYQLTQSLPDELKSSLPSIEEIERELGQLARDIRETDQRGKKMNLRVDELAFYDTLADHPNAEAVLGDQKLKEIAHELVESVRKNTSIDWQLKESVQAKLRVLVKRILRKYKYPPDDPATGEYTASVNKVLDQAELLADFWTRNE